MRNISNTKPRHCFQIQEPKHKPRLWSVYNTWDISLVKEEEYWNISKTKPKHYFQIQEPRHKPRLWSVYNTWDISLSRNKSTEIYPILNLNIAFKFKNLDTNSDYFQFKRAIRQPRFIAEWILFGYVCPVYGRVAHFTCRVGRPCPIMRKSF